MNWELFYYVPQTQGKANTKHWTTDSTKQVTEQNMTAISLRHIQVYNNHPHLQVELCEEQWKAQIINEVFQVACATVQGSGKLSVMQFQVEVLHHFCCLAEAYL